MSTTTLFPQAMVRLSSVALLAFQKFLMIAGCIFLLGVAVLFAGHEDVNERLRAVLAPAETAAMEEVAAAEAAVDEGTQAASELSRRMQGALDYVSRRYRVSNEALEPIFQAAQAVGTELKLDPLLIIAVIGVESGFNPFSESVVGAQGLMQVVPRFHQDKLGDSPVSILDPVTNVQVGARVLKESIRRQGGIEEGLQQFAGAAGDASRRYALRVLAERQRIEAAVQRFRTS